MKVSYIKIKEFQETSYYKDPLPYHQNQIVFIPNLEGHLVLLKYGDLFRWNRKLFTVTFYDETKEHSAKDGFVLGLRTIYR
jgi:hypothetical protein